MKPHAGDEIVEELLEAGHRVRSAVDTALRGLGLSVARLKVLRLLEHGPASMKQLSDALHIAPRSTTDLVDGLVELGFVVRSSHPRDRRVTLLALTPEGAARLDAGRRVAHAVHRAATRRIPTERRQELVTLLGVIGEDARACAPPPPQELVGRH